jgi:hypothetical protein
MPGRGRQNVFEIEKMTRLAQFWVPPQSWTEMSVPV